MGLIVTFFKHIIPICAHALPRDSDRVMIIERIDTQIHRPSGLGAPEVPPWKGDDEEQALQAEEAGEAKPYDASLNF